jgi:hypothetical protein
LLRRSVSAILRGKGGMFQMLSSLLFLILTASLTVPAQQQSFTVAGIKPYDKAVPGQVMEVLIEGLSNDSTPTVLPEKDFAVEVLQDGVAQTAQVRVTKFTMISAAGPRGSNAPPVDPASSGRPMRAYQAVSFIVPKGLHPGPSEVVASYKGKRGNPVSMEIVEKPLRPVVGTLAVIAVGAMPPERTAEMKPRGNDLGWRLERGTTARLSVHPLVDPDDPNSAVVIRFKQAGNEYDAATHVKSSPSRVESRGQGVGYFAARDELEVEVPAALMAGQADVEIRVKANGQLSDPVNLSAMITDVTRAGEEPNVTAPRVLAVTPQRVGAGQSFLISIDQRRALEPSPKQTQVIVEQNGVRYTAEIEKNSAVAGVNKEPDAPVALFARTTRQLIGRVQIRVLNPLRGEPIGLSTPATLEIVDEVLPPELLGVSESTADELARLKEIYEAQKAAGKEFHPYDPASRYLTVRARGIDYNPRFVRIMLEQAGQKFTLTPADYSSYSTEGLIVRLPKELKGGSIKLTIENSDGQRYSTPVNKSFVLAAP